MFNWLNISKLLNALGVSKRQELLTYSKLEIGTIQSGTLAPIEYGCAEAMNNIFSGCFGAPIGGDVSTLRLYQALQSSYRFVKVTTGLPGDIVISPTGFGNGSIPNGHVGVLSDDGYIMSNNSANGTWDEHLSVDAWHQRYVAQGGYPMYYFRVVV